MAEAIGKSGYVPPARRDEYDYHDRLAKSVQDRQVAKWHRDQARKIREQVGEEVR
jgi:hypothetical protein